jgi:putative membrane protein insertion efficiency factor
MSATRLEWRPGAAAARWLRALRDLPRSGLVALVLAYRFALKPWLGNACRFEPSCSAYALEALQRHGALAGSALGTARLLRCHPWCEGGYDPVPQHAPRLFTRLLAKTRP